MSTGTSLCRVSMKILIPLRYEAVVYIVILCVIAQALE
jgi:hypothetical protein